MSEEKQPHVYKMNDCEWIAGFDLESAIAFYLDLTGVSAEDGLDDPVELGDKAMEALKYNCDAERSDDGRVITFRERLAELMGQGQEFPCFFATTEY